MLHHDQTWRAIRTDACGKRITCTITRTITCATISASNIANQIHGFTVDYGKLILVSLIILISFILKCFFLLVLPVLLHVVHVVCLGSENYYPVHSEFRMSNQ